jgi:O-acetyl-ADP-ribose deacetylase (regulator of RNase III)
MVKTLVGNLFESRAGALVNPVNCVGVMGKGVAQEFKKRYPVMFEDYAQRCAQKGLRLGEPYLFVDPSGIQILNFPTKDHWRSPSRLSDIKLGLDYFVSNYRVWGVKSVAFPALGCGNGGLRWQEVEPLMLTKLSSLKIDVEIYAPRETTQPQGDDSSYQAA